MKQKAIVVLCISFLLAGLVSGDVWKDDFERAEIGENWTQGVWRANAAPDWKIEDGVLKGCWAHGFGQILFLDKYPSLDYTIQVKCRIDRARQVSDYGGGWIGFRGAGPGPVDPFYCFGLIPACSKFFIARGGQNWADAARVPENHNIGQWYTIKVVVVDDVFTGYVDDKLVCEMRDRFTIKGGFVSLGVAEQADASFDDFMITDSVDEDALSNFAVSLKGALATTWTRLKNR